MTKRKNKQIKNDIKPERQIAGVPESVLLSELFKSWHIVFDLSFEGCFCSVNESDFNNFLKNEKDFATQYKNCINSLNKLSSHTLSQLMDVNNFRHCHKVENENKAYRIIKKLCYSVGKDESYFEQNVGSEPIFQIGFEGSVRFFGTIKGNIFRLLFIDYFHDFSFDERRNQRNRKYYIYCPIIDR